MNIWTVANQKGGVGKTTTTVTLGGLLAAQGRRTLLVDLDPHGSLTAYFGYNPDSIEESVYSLFTREVAKSRMPVAAMLRKTGMPGLDLLPACMALITLERHVTTLNGMGLVVRNALRGFHKHYQYILIDCSPALGILMINALAACDALLVPVQTEFLALKGLERMLNTLSMMSLSGQALANYLIIPTMYDRRTRASRDSLEFLHNHYRQHLWPGFIPIDTNFRESSRLGRPLSALAPGSKGVRAYASLLSGLAERESSMAYREAG